MEATVTYKKKIIDLKEDTFKALSVMAARQGTNLKKLIGVSPTFTTNVTI